MRRALPFVVVGAVGFVAGAAGVIGFLFLDEKLGVRR